MIVENQLDCGAGRIGRIKELEEIDELSTAVAVSDQGMDFPGEQINTGQQANRAAIATTGPDLPTRRYASGFQCF
jgi:hypothetical protein